MAKSVAGWFRVLAKITLAVGVIGAAILVIAAPVSGLYLLLLVGAVMLLMSIISWLVISAFAEMLETVNEIKQILKIGFANEISEDTEQKRRIEQERRDREQEMQREYEERWREEEEKRRAEEAARQARIASYWEKHSEEKAALLEKRADAENKLREAGGLAGKQRTVLQELINAIDEELTKDRED